MPEVSVLALEPVDPELAPIDDELPVEPLADGLVVEGLVEGLLDEEELLLPDGVVVALLPEGDDDEPEAPIVLLELLSEDDGVLVLPEADGVLLPEAPMLLDEPVVPGCTVLLPLEPAPPVEGALALLPAVPLLEVLPAAPEVPGLPEPDDWATA